MNGLNLSCYCLNNPILYADSSGYVVISAVLIGLIMGVAFAFGGTVVKDLSDGELFNGDVSGKVNSAIKKLGIKYDDFKSMTIGKNSMDEFIEAFEKTISNTIFTNVYAGIIDILLVSVDHLITNY